MKQPKWCLDVWLTVVISLGFKVLSVPAQCDWLKVSGSAYTNTQLNGHYLRMTYYVCNLRYTWFTDENDIAYSKDINTTDRLTTPGWSIGPNSCGRAPYYAINVAGSNYSYPNLLPSGTWLERNSINGTYFPNPNLRVTCSTGPYLSSWAITGIVFGSICGVILLFSLIVACVKRYRNKQERRTTTDNQSGLYIQTANQSAEYTGNPNVANNAGFSTESSEFDPAYMNGGLGASMVQPPAYDNLKPPDYEQASH